MSPTLPPAAPPYSSPTTDPPPPPRSAPPAPSRSHSAASWPMTRSASTMSPDQPQAPQKQTNTRSWPVQYSVVSPCPPSASDKAAAHPGQYQGASRRCRSASSGNQPRPTSPPATTPLPGEAPE